MNKLDKYRDEKAELLFPIREEVHNNGMIQKTNEEANKKRKKNWKKGFDAAIKLDLPTKFAMFLRHECAVSSDEGIYYQGKIVSINWLYNYWLEHEYQT